MQLLTGLDTAPLGQVTNGPAGGEVDNEKLPEPEAKV